MTARLHALAAAELVACVAASVATVQAVQVHAWAWAAACGWSAAILLAGCLHTVEWAAERRTAARLLEVTARPDPVDDLFALGWADCDAACCLRGHLTHGEQHDAGHCREQR